MKSINIRYKARSDLGLAKHTLGPIQPSRLLIQVFCGKPDESFIRELISNITHEFPGAQLIGATTAGEIMEGESLDQTTVINFTQFAMTEVHSAITNQNHDLFQAGCQLATDTGKPDTKLAILFGCGIKNGGAINGEPLLAGFQSVRPDVVIAGGQAGDNGLVKTTYVFTQDGFTHQGVVAASLSGNDLVMNNSYNLSWVPLGKTMEVTLAEGSRILTIDDKSAKEVYTHYLGDSVGDRLPSSAAEFPLVVERHGMQLARHANKVMPDGSLEFMAPFHTGEKVRFAFCHTGLISDSARHMYDELSHQEYDAIFVYSCLSRKWVLGKDSKLELAPLACLAPTSGFFSYGEYYTINSQNFFLSQTMTIVALSENGTARPKRAARGHAIPGFGAHETKQVQDLQALHRLVETSANEREVLIGELQAALHEIKTLRGFIPICANCKSIRDDKGYWNAVEKYIQDRTDAQFSHSICPDCMKTLYPEIYDDLSLSKSKGSN